jgi:hypothetical protein
VQWVDPRIFDEAKAEHVGIQARAIPGKLAFVQFQLRRVEKYMLGIHPVVSHAQKSHHITVGDYFPYNLFPNSFAITLQD